MSKQDRQRKILEIINENSISTQEELVERLRNEGLNVTQATISRDINELNIVKANRGKGKQRFVAMKNNADPDKDRLLKVFSEAVTYSNTSRNLLVIHTLPGMAPACASAIDAMNLSEIAGTLAGDDTVFVAVIDGVSAGIVERDVMQFARNRGLVSE